MAKYRIIAPDGRKFMITGEEIPPTQEQVRALITNYQEPSIKAQAASISKLHQGLRPLTEEEKERAKALAKEIRPKKTYGDYLVNNLADIAFGAKKALSGATFGASDWLGRKMGVDMSDQSYLSARDAENLGTAARTAGFVSEIGGNMLGAGGGLLKTLGKTGLKGLKLATAAGGIEGGIYGLTGSDTLKDVPIKMSVGSALGALLPVGIHGVGYGTKWAARPLTDKVTHYLGKRKLAKQLAKGADFDDVNLGNVDDELATPPRQSPPPLPRPDPVTKRHTHNGRLRSGGHFLLHRKAPLPPFPRLPRSLTPP